MHHDDKLFCLIPSGSGQSHGAAGSGGQNKGEDLWEAKDLLCRSS